MRSGLGLEGARSPASGIDTSNAVKEERPGHSLNSVLPSAVLGELKKRTMAWRDGGRAEAQ